MKIQLISDSHNMHGQIEIDQSIDMVIFCGDESNLKNPYLNEQEFLNFYEWYKSLNVQYKLFVAGNHSTYIFNNEREARKLFEDAGIIYLNKDEVTIEGIKFYGDPTTPSFGDWVFMSKREKMKKHWDLIPDDVNVLITHGPPKYMLDLSFKKTGELEFCGCSNLRKRIRALKYLKLSVFGHIHNNYEVENAGIKIVDGVTFVNASMVKDGAFNKGLINNGQIVEL